MAIRHDITLSTTEPNNNIGLLKIRQADEQTQTLVVQLTATNQPKSYEGLQAFFCAKLGQSIGLGIIEQKLEQSEMTNPKNGQLEYTFRPEDWQQIGRQTGYFSFRKMKDDGHEYVEQFTTRDFYFNVTKNVFSEGLTEVKKDGSTYVWTIEDLKRLYQEYIASGRTDWEEFVNQNREILESIDPGGKILASLGKLVDFRKWDTDLILKMKNEFEERGGNPLWYGAVGDGEHDDSLALIACFENHDTIVFPQNKIFKISWDISDRRSFYVFKDRKNIKIEGPSAVIFDSNTYVDRTLNDVLNFENCENVYVNLNGKGYPVSERETDLGYIGSAFITATKGTKGLTLKGHLENFRYGFRSGDFGNPENGNSANIKVDLDTIDVGYPVACYLTDNIEVNVDAEHVHRAGYFAACKNVRGNIKYAGFAMSRMNVLITNLSIGNDGSKGCSNIRLNIVDDSSYSSLSKDWVVSRINSRTINIYVYPRRIRKCLT